MSEFNGLNCCNNAVKVDFIHETVKFSPIPKSFFDVYTDFFFTFLMSCILLSIGIVVVSLLALFFGVGIVFWGQFAFFLLFVASPIIALVYSLGFFHRGWREHSYPEHNARMNYFLSMFTNFRSNKTFLTVNPDAIVNNTFFVPIVSNVVLEYEATLDFAFYLESIEVVNRYLGMDGDWFVVIKWSQTPIDGVMKLVFD